MFEGKLAVQFDFCKDTYAHVLRYARSVHLGINDKCNEHRRE